MKILDVCCRWPGSAHDATIFTNSNLYFKMTQGDFGDASVILGDSAYGPDRFICKPLKNAISDSEINYQRCQIKTRNIAERTFGVLKERFQCLHRGLSYKLPKIQDVIVACCILHNFIKHDQMRTPIEPREINLQRAIERQFLLTDENRQLRVQSYLINNYF